MNEDTCRQPKIVVGVNDSSRVGRSCHRRRDAASRAELTLGGLAVDARGVGSRLALGGRGAVVGLLPSCGILALSLGPHDDLR